MPTHTIESLLAERRKYMIFSYLLMTLVAVIGAIVITVTLYLVWYWTGIVGVAVLVGLCGLFFILGGSFFPGIDWFFTTLLYAAFAAGSLIVGVACAVGGIAYKLVRRQKIFTNTPEQAYMRASAVLNENEYVFEDIEGSTYSITPAASGKADSYDMRQLHPKGHAVNHTDSSLASLLFELDM